jgi:predicted SprT family Zn-dependent metalloprotease
MAITRTPPCEPVPPTLRAYHEVQLAYDFFNVEFYSGKLPPALITFRGKGSRSLGYYSPKRFATTAGVTTDEIALNTRHFKNQSFTDVMATLVHEMVHLWQQHFGAKRSRSAYHNKEWAGEMLRLGLHPSHTGRAGGRMTGQQMHHYIAPQGAFAIAVKKLTAMLPGITWFDVQVADMLPKGLADLELVTPPRGLSGRRTIYRCPSPSCGDRAEGKSTLFLICGKCNLQMTPVGLR